MGNEKGREVQGFVFTIASRGEGEGDFLCAGKGSSKDGQDQGFEPAPRVPAPISQPCPMSQTNFLGLVNKEGEKAKGQGCHEADPLGGKEGKRSQKPDQRILKLSRTGDSGKKNPKAQDQSQSPERKRSGPKPIAAHRNRRKRGLGSP